MKQILCRGALAAGLLGLTACAGAPPLEQVLLSPPQSASADRGASHWEVQRVKMPAYLDSTDIQIRTSDYVLTRLADAKWAQRLPIAMTRLLQRTIDEQAGEAGKHDYRVTVDVDSFEPRWTGQVVLSARWRVTRADGRDPVASDTARIQQPLAAEQRTATDIGRAMSSAVRQLATRIVDQAG